MNQFATELIELIKNHLSDILPKESCNLSHIHLYRADNYWVSFERSAFHLSRFFPRAIITPMKIIHNPFPIVMASIEDKYLPIVEKNLHCESRAYNERSYKVIKPNQALSFQVWHNQQVKCIM